MLIRPPDSNHNQLVKSSLQPKHTIKLQTKLLSPLLVGNSNNNNNNTNSKSATQLQRPITSQTLSRNPNPSQIPKRLLSPRSKKVNLIVKNALACTEDITDEHIVHEIPSNVYQFRQFVPQRSKSPENMSKLKFRSDKPGSFTQRTNSKAENSSRPLKTEFIGNGGDSPFHIRNFEDYNLPLDGIDLSKRMSSETGSPIGKNSPTANKKYGFLEYDKVLDVPYPIIHSKTPEMNQAASLENLTGRPLLSPKIKKIVNPVNKETRNATSRSKKKTREERQAASLERSDPKMVSYEKNEKDNKEQKKIKEIPMSQAMFRMKEFKRVKKLVSKRKAMNSGNMFAPGESQNKFYSVGGNQQQQIAIPRGYEEQRKAIQLYMIKKNEEYLRNRLFVTERTATNDSLEYLGRDSKETLDGGESVDRTKYMSRHKTDISQDYMTEQSHQRLKTLPEDHVEMSFSGLRKPVRNLSTIQIHMKHKSEEDYQHTWDIVRRSQGINHVNMDQRKDSNNKLKTETGVNPPKRIIEMNKLDMTKFLKIMDKQQKPALLTGEGSTALSTERKREAETRELKESSKTLSSTLQKQRSERDFLINHYEAAPQQDINNKFKLMYPAKKKLFVKPATPSRGVALNHLLIPSNQETHITLLSKDSLRTPVNAANKGNTKVMEDLHEISQISIKQIDMNESFEFENLVKYGDEKRR